VKRLSELQSSHGGPSGDANVAGSAGFRTLRQCRVWGTLLCPCAVDKEDSGHRNPRSIEDWLPRGQRRPRTGLSGSSYDSLHEMAAAGIITGLSLASQYQIVPVQ
jgi:hypothetical protein